MAKAYKVKKNTDTSQYIMRGHGVAHDVPVPVRQFPVSEITQNHCQGPIDRIQGEYSRIFTAVAEYQEKYIQHTTMYRIQKNIKNIEEIQKRQNIENVENIENVKKIQGIQRIKHMQTIDQKRKHF